MEGGNPDRPDDSSKNDEHRQQKVEKLKSATIKTQSEKYSFQEPELVRIPGGEFMMGSPKSERDRFEDEKQYKVQIEHFAIGKYPVTFSEYDRYCEVTGLTKPDNEDWGEGQPACD